MANKEHLKILNQGVKVWNQWRVDNLGLIPDLRGANLSEANLSAANLSEANLITAQLRGANLGEANLSAANLILADLSAANLILANLSLANPSFADLSFADLSLANLVGTNLNRAKLREAKLKEADLGKTVFHFTDLTNTDFQDAQCNATIFADVDLTSCKNLETTLHEGLSTIGIGTLYKSQGKIPKVFLRGCGVPENLLGNTTLLMESVAVESSSKNLNTSSTITHPVSAKQRDQVFVSYSHDDITWLNKLTRMLSPSIRQHMIKMWSDIHILPGSKWKDEIRNALASAQVAVFLVSPYFLASDFIASEELPPLLKAANDEGVTILWVPISASMYRTTPLAQYQAAIDPKKPLDMFSDAEQAMKLVEIGEKIIEAMNK